jgi:hypothetical protein
MKHQKGLELGLGSGLDIFHDLKLNRVRGRKILMKYEKELRIRVRVRVRVRVTVGVSIRVNVRIRVRYER